MGGLAGAVRPEPTGGEALRRRAVPAGAHVVGRGAREQAEKVVQLPPRQPLGETSTHSGDYD